ncbi:MAG: hypothetical protein EXR62_04500 [Chloroflexi bacterium]|nr:hypothetical protein [Chloroflexota bacterium]
MRWIEPPSTANPNPIMEVVQDSLLARLLVQRGLDTPAAVKAFLDPSAYMPADPTALPGMDQAVAAILAAMERRQVIGIYGDFDVDGQSATALLVLGLRELGARVTYTIPERRESHGLNPKRLEDLVRDGVRLVITCDCGITDHQIIADAAAQGLPVIVTDHHTPIRRVDSADLSTSSGAANQGETGSLDIAAGKLAAAISAAFDLPAAQAVINPKLLPANHPLAELPGVGTAYKLLEALANHLGRPHISHKMLDLVALGIVADAAKQTGDCRYLLQRGLPDLLAGVRPGIRALWETAGQSGSVEAESMDTEAVAFGLAPRLNAAGRLASATTAVELLLTNDGMLARKLAQGLELLNQERQRQSSAAELLAEALISQRGLASQEEPLVLASTAWQAGITGLVAGRLAERYHRPAILITLPDKDTVSQPAPSAPSREAVATASARSIPGVDIQAAIAAQGDLIIKSGGHAMAAGFSILPENVEKFRLAISRTLAAPKAQAGGPALAIDLEIGSLEEISQDLAERVQRLAPFGNGNPVPIFMLRRALLTNVESLGLAGKHVRLRIQDRGNRRVEAIWWRTSESAVPRGPVDVAFVLRSEIYKGERRLRLIIQDVHAPEAPQHIQEENSAPYTVGDVPAFIPPAKVVDWRNLPQAERLLQVQQQDQKRPGLQIWAEGPDQQMVAGTKTRWQLEAGVHLVVYTAPATAADWRQALATTQPAMLTLLTAPLQPSLQKFLTQVILSARDILQQQDGVTTWIEWTTRLACSESLLRAALEVLADRQKLSATDLGKTVRLSSHHTPAPAAGQTDRRRILVALLEESNAFRRYFQRAPPEQLIDVAETL